MSGPVETDSYDLPDNRDVHVVIKPRREEGKQTIIEGQWDVTVQGPHEVFNRRFIMQGASSDHVRNDINEWVNKTRSFLEAGDEDASAADGSVSYYV